MNWILIILGLNIIAVTVIYILLRRRIDRAVRSTELLSQIELEIDKIVTELNLTTERNVTLMEDRIRTMTNLIEQADKKLLLLSRESERKHHTASPVYTRPKMASVQDEQAVNLDISIPPVPPSAGIKVPMAGPEDPIVEAIVPEVNLSTEPLPVKVDFKANRPEISQEPPKTSKQKVLEMNAAGEDINTIASILNITLGEIELILSMNQRSSPER